MEIELFKEEYADELSRIVYETIDEMEKLDPSGDYSLVRAEDTPQELIRASREGTMWLARADDKIVGTVSLMDGRLRRFFVHPNYQRRGIGKALIKRVSEYAKEHNQREIYVGAVLNAVPTYKRLGFSEGEIFFNPEIKQNEMKMRLIL